MRTYDVCARTSRDPSGRDRIEFARAPRRPDGTRATIQSMIHSRGRRHWCPLFGSEHVRGSRSSGRAAGTAAGASVRSARMSRASRLKRAFARVSRNAPSWSRTGTPRRLCQRARTPTRPPRDPPRCGPWTPQPRSRRARDPSRRHAVPAERRRATPRRIPPRRLTPRRTKWRDLGTQQVCQERKKECVDHSACGVLQPRPRSPVKKKLLLCIKTERFVRVDVEQGYRIRTDIE